MKMEARCFFRKSAGVYWNARCYSVALSERENSYFEFIFSKAQHLRQKTGIADIELSSTEYSGFKLKDSYF
jgi:hypothetical protein